MGGWHLPGLRRHNVKKERMQEEELGQDMGDELHALQASWRRRLLEGTSLTG